MDLLIPEIGLVVWTTISFLIVLFLLAKFAWKPIIKAVEDRENSIKSSLDEAKKAREEMANLTSQNEKILQEAKIERDAILKEARELKSSILAEAKEIAVKESEQIVASARLEIEGEKMAAINSLKNEVAQLSLDIAEKIVRKDLSKDDEQKRLVDALIKESKFN